ncbi:hypothetical protein [Haloarchaeobius amylolyticus]|uniref:hypothetical protein n=1 Tax=Haloarchaeobius amylolyticus TaxID=1198296 RepID=UPI0022717A3A|nr:hypothetical protein [Haloarchaeobius amylolyticus]
MATLPRRQYLAAVGSGLVALSVGVVGGTVGRRATDREPVSATNRVGAGAPDPLQFSTTGMVRLDFERDADGNVEFDDPVSGTSFETTGDEVEFDDPFTRCRERPSEAFFELERVGRPGSDLDYLELERDGDAIDLRLSLGGEAIEAEFDDDRYELTVAGAPLDFEDDGGNDVEYRGLYFDLETKGRAVEIRGSLRLDFDGVDDLELRDVGVDFRSDSGQFRSTSTELGLDFERDTGEFEAGRFV